MSHTPPLLLRCRPRRLVSAIAVLATILVLLGSNADAVSTHTDAVSAHTTTRYLYWVSDGKSIVRAPLDASGEPSCPASGCVPFITSGLAGARGIAVDDSWIYWANSGSNSIGRVALDGVTDLNPAFIFGDSVSAPYGVTVSGGNLYWTNNNSASIGTAPVSGTDPHVILHTSVGGSPTGVAVDSQNIYWADGSLSEIGQAPLANPGAAKPDFVSGPNTVIASPMSLAVGGGSLFWTNFADSAHGYIAESVPVALPHTATPVKIHTGDNPLGLAVSSRRAYWANQSNNTIGTSDLAGRDASQIDPQTASIQGLAVTPDLDPVLSLAQIRPDHGPIGVPDQLTITGTELNAGTTVQLGADQCTQVMVNPLGTSLTCSAESAQAGAVDVVVTNSYGQLGVLPSGFTFQNSPAFSPTDPVAPDHCQVLLSCEIRINGTRFVVASSSADSTAVTVGGARCDLLLPQSTPNMLVCLTESGYPTLGPVDVTLTNPDGTSATLPQGFTYLPPGPVLDSAQPVVPAQGFANDPTQITIRGENFSQGAKVAIVNDQFPCQDVSINQAGTTITCTVQANRPGLADVIVTNPDGQAAIATGGFNYLIPLPAVTGVTPATASTAGGQRITVAGNYFVNGATVRVGSAQCLDVVVALPTSLTCVLGSVAEVGPVTVTVTNPDGNTISADHLFTYVLSAPTITSISPVAGGVNAAQPVTITGTGFTRTSTVSFGGQTCTDPQVSAGGTSVTCSTPLVAEAGAVDVTVNNGTQIATLTGAFTFGRPDYLYWISGAGQIGRVSGNGYSQPDFVSIGAHSPRGIAMDDQWIYWANNADNSIGRVSQDGKTGLNPAFITGAAVNGPYGIAVSKGKIYWTNLDSHSIGVANADGSNARQLLDAGSYAQPAGLAVDGTNIYWGDVASDQIGQASLANPSTVNGNFVPNSTISQPYGLAVGSGALYWTNFMATNGNFSIGSIQLTDPAGPGKSIPAGPNPLGIAVTNTRMLWANQGNNTITTTSLSGTDPQTIDPDATGLFGIATDPSSPALPTVIAISPSTGSTQGNVAVTVSGSGFEAGATVTIGGAGCMHVSVVDASHLQCTTAAHSGGHVGVTVINPDLEIGSSPGQIFTYQDPPPTVTLISPNSGSVSGGYQTTLIGTALTDGVTITIGGRACPVVGAGDDGSSVTCTVPAASAPAVVDVVVTAIGQQPVVVHNGFTYSDGGELLWANNQSPAQGSPGNSWEQLLSWAANPLPLNDSCNSVRYGTIGMSNTLPGTPVNQCWVNDPSGKLIYNPVGVASDGSHIYWADQGLQTIGVANLDGSDPKTLIDLGTTNGDANPSYLAVAGTKIYWTDAGQSGRDGSIGSANLDGTDVVQNWIHTDQGSSGSSPMGLVADAGFLYWADNSNRTIGRARIDGTVDNPALIHTEYNPAGIAINNGYLYWANDPGSGSSAVGSIGRVQLTTPNAPDQTWIPQVISPAGVAVAGGYLYWTGAGDAEAGTGVIGRSDLDKSTVLPDFKVGANSPQQIATVGGS